jgi:hypothetical protein
MAFCAVRVKCIALRLGAHIAAGGVQLQAHVLHGALFVFGLAPREQADAVFDGPGAGGVGPAGWCLALR